VRIGTTVRFIRTLYTQLHVVKGGGKHSDPFVLVLAVLAVLASNSASEFLMAIALTRCQADGLL
jgi:hypothetical protein